MLLVTAHAADVCFVNLCRSILPAVPTECDVLIVCRQHNDKEWKFKEQHAKMWENIAGAKRYSRPRGCNIAWESAPAAPAVPTPLRDKGRGAYGMNCMDEKAPSNYDTIRYEMLF